MSFLNFILVLIQTLGFKHIDVFQPTTVIILNDVQNYIIFSQRYPI